MKYSNQCRMPFISTSIDFGPVMLLSIPEKIARTHLKNASKCSWLCCPASAGFASVFMEYGAAQPPANAHILACMLRFFAEPRLDAYIIS
jgi:hypothetical protein